MAGPLAQVRLGIAVVLAAVPVENIGHLVHLVAVVEAHTHGAMHIAAHKAARRADDQVFPGHRLIPRLILIHQSRRTQHRGIQLSLLEQIQPLGQLVHHQPVFLRGRDLLELLCGHIAADELRIGLDLAVREGAGIGLDAAPTVIEGFQHMQTLRGAGDLSHCLRVVAGLAPHINERLLMPVHHGDGLHQHLPHRRLVGNVHGKRPVIQRGVRRIRTAIAWRKAASLRCRLRRIHGGGRVCRGRLRCVRGCGCRCRGRHLHRR